MELTCERFIGQDIASHPERLQAVDPALARRIHLLLLLLGDCPELDLDAALSDSDE